ncbi:ABC transporter C family member 1, putative [Plasmodium gallinaceum]|uniref:Multidrug resistance-associated protein 1, putative n=1 Tax=Plasmodium gallinaceum TaxID=5849 RepID=A0A1J1H073_PLAGA|nr:ABC transporter C family member 1, putative [Plasmodium gallinaceum]CRG98216.1 ABC transporter C family member 1, putative [Plasmodium gallinaceum]
MSIYEKRVEDYYKYNEKKETTYVSWLSFITFHWVTELIDSLKKDEIEFPKIQKNDNISFYISKLEQNLRNIHVKESVFVNNFYKKKDINVEYNYDSDKIRRNEEYNVYYNSVILSIFKTFKFHIILIFIFNILHTLFVISSGGCINIYMLLLKGEMISSFPLFLTNSNLLFGLFVVILLVSEFFFDSILNFYYNELLVNMKISMMHFLYKINLNSYENHLINDYIYKHREKISGFRIDEIDGRISDYNINNNFSCTSNFYAENHDKEISKKHCVINFFKKEKDKKGEEIKLKNIAHINIYNVMFSDIPSLVLFIGSIIQLSNIFVKFYMSYYVFYIKMGYNAVIHALSLSIVLYSSVILFEFLPSIFKRKYLKYRDRRIDNMHHILNKFKLIKMFNWESIAFNYVNFFRKKEMKFCKIRLYLGNIGIYINAISADIIEVVLFFFFIREKLNDKKEINFSSIIMPLFVYKSLISGVINFPNLMNNLIEGVVNIRRINKYVYHHIYYNDINNYFKYISRSTDFNITTGETYIENEEARKLLLQEIYNKKKIRFVNLFSFFFFSKRKKKINTINREILSGLSYNINENIEKEYFEFTINCRDDNNNSIHPKKEIDDKDNKNMVKKKENKEIIKLENCSFSLIQEYPSKCDNYILKNINFNLKNNTLAIIIGNVGSGKTALFHSILGYLKLTYGYMYIKNFLYNMQILYTPQHSWVPIGNIRSMILFGNEYNSFIYRLTIMQSHLLLDIKSYKDEDMRYISDENNLSEGQKTRISLARSLYQHYIHMYKLGYNCEKERIMRKRLNKEINMHDLINDSYNKNETNMQNDLFYSYIRNHVRKKNITYLYLLDDVFTYLDPSISKNIFYNLFCREEQNKYFKDNCSFIASMNKNTFESFLTNETLDNIHYNVDIYKLENFTLHYNGNISKYIKENNITIKKENNLNKKKLTINNIKLKYDFNGNKYNKKNDYMNFKKSTLSKRPEINYSFKINNDSFKQHNKEKIITSIYLDNDKNIGNSKNKNNDSIKKLIEEDNNLFEYKNISKNSSLELEHGDNLSISYIGVDEDESYFKGKIQLTTYIWYLKHVGYVLIFYIVLFMLISSFTEEIKNFLLYMISIISRKDDEYSNKILQQQTKYLHLFVLFPIISSIASFICFILILHGTLLSAIKVHTNVLVSILSIPLHVYYNNNLGNIINRFITDIYSLDYGFLKRIYKAVFVFFRLFLSVVLLIFLMKDTIFIFPCIILLIYFFVFKKYSEGFKEAQRGYLRAHSPLCNMYSNIILGKNIINLYKKNVYFLNIYEHYITLFKNYSLSKRSITIWASLYTRFIVLILTTYYIMYPLLIFNIIPNMQKETNYEKMLSTIGYCITFSSRIGIIIKILLCDYTYVEKEMCCVQRLEELSKMSNGMQCLNIEDEGEQEKKKKKKKNISGYMGKKLSLNDKTDLFYVDELKKKYSIYIENLFVSYKRKVLLDKKSNTYCYVDEESYLKNINMYALKNQKIGIIGKSGSGKSTIILSILGLLPFNEGKITIEGIDIRKINRREKDNIIGVLPQSTLFFFNWNIRMLIDPHQNFSDEEIVDTFKLFGINLSFTDLDKYIYKQPKKKNKEKKKKKGKINDSSNRILLTDECMRYLSLVRLFLNRYKYKLILIDEIPIFNFDNVDLELNYSLIGKVKPFNYIIKNYFCNNTVIIISHNTHALSCCDFIYVIRMGEVAYRCSSKDIKTQSELADLLEKDE